MCTSSQAGSAVVGRMPTCRPGRSNRKLKHSSLPNSWGSGLKERLQWQVTYMTCKSYCCMLKIVMAIM